MFLFKAIILRFRLIWAVLCGRHIQLYRSVLAGNPIAYRIYVDGAIQAGNNAAIVECAVTKHEMRDGISVGANSNVIGCAVRGARRNGITVNGTVLQQTYPIEFSSN